MIGAALLLGTIGCSRNTVHIPSPIVDSPADNSYVDLAGGWRLRILVPLVKSGGNIVATNCTQQRGNVIVCSAPNLIGYQVSYYSAYPSSKGKVNLRFISAETTIDAKTVQERNPLPLPFHIPTKAQHIRLVYLVRVSEADHDMAITAGKNREVLNVFTKRLKEDPNVCEQVGEVFCTWVPKGISVTPESLSELQEK